MGDAFASFALAVVLAASSVPNPAPSPVEAPLREIGHVRVTTPLCRKLLDEASRTVEIDLQNDHRVNEAIVTLATVDLDTSRIAKQRGSQDITLRFVTLRAAAVAGNTLMARFREDARQAPTEEQKKALTLFADALDGALHRQRKFADNLGHLIAYLDANEPITKEEHDGMIFDALLAQSNRRTPAGPFNNRAFGTRGVVPDQLSTSAKNASNDLATLLPAIADDENAAAARIDPAFDRC